MGGECEGELIECVTGWLRNMLFFALRSSTLNYNGNPIPAPGHVVTLFAHQVKHWNNVAAGRGSGGGRLQSLFGSTRPVHLVHLRRELHREMGYVVLVQHVRGDLGEKRLTRSH